MFTGRIPAILLAIALCLDLCACEPAGPPPDIIKTQREDLQKARAVKDIQDKAVQEQAKSIDQQMKAADDQAKQDDNAGK